MGSHNATSKECRPAKVSGDQLYHKSLALIGSERCVQVLGQLTQSISHIEIIATSRRLENERPGSNLILYPNSQAAFFKQLLWAKVSPSRKKTTWKTTMVLHGFKRSPEHLCQALSRGESASNSHLLGSRVEHANNEVTYWSDDQRNVALMVPTQVPRNGPLPT